MMLLRNIIRRRLGLTRGEQLRTEHRQINHYQGVNEQQDYYNYIFPVFVPDTSIFYIDRIKIISDGTIGEISIVRRVIVIEVVGVQVGVLAGVEL